MTEMYSFEAAEANSEWQRCEQRWPGSVRLLLVVLAPTGAWLLVLWSFLGLAKHFDVFAAGLVWWTGPLAAMAS